jgi:hypothetical protein
MMQAAAAMSAYWFVLRPVAGTPERPCQRTTRFIASHDGLPRVVVMQIGNVYLCRSPRRSTFSASLTSNN